MTIVPAGSAQVEIRDLSKTFDGVRALDSVSVPILRGSITALLGMNGSGKSTLIKILAGVYHPDHGARLFVGGEEAHLPLTPATSRELGFRFLHQDVGLIPELTVADNFALADGFPVSLLSRAIKRRAHNRAVRSSLEFFDIDVHPETLIADLDPTTRTMIGIARLFHDADPLSAETIQRHTIVLDEPTASLPSDEVDRVLAVLERVRDLGGTVIYVSHRTDEVRKIADRLVILRDGRLVEDRPIADHTPQEIVQLVVGRTIAALDDKRSGPVDEPPVLTIRDISGPRLRDVSLSVSPGEIVGIAGLVGCGRSELVRILSGAQQPVSGTMTLADGPYAPHAPRAAIRAGVACVPQERRVDGCVLDMSVAANVTLGRMDRFVNRIGVIRTRDEVRDASDRLDAYGVKRASDEMKIGQLSGGNQQKVVVARAAAHDLKLLVLDEPTQGVDAWAKQEIARSLRALADDGLALVVGSSDFQELADLCDRVIVLDRGHHRAEVTGAHLTEDNLALLSSHPEAS